MKADRDQERFCRKCHIGSLRSFRTTYTHWYEEQLVTIPGVSAWRCDFCGEVLYDNEVLTRLGLLLGLESDFEFHRRWHAGGLEENREASFRFV